MKRRIDTPVGHRRLRWAIFSSSVVSAIDNPDAYLLRALGRHLVARGHEATFFEERGNQAVRALLRRSGGRALADFRERYPDIDYRTVEPQSGVVLVEWLTRTLGTYDIALVQRDTPAEMAAWLSRMTRSHLQTYLLDSGLGRQPAETALATPGPENFSGVFVGSEEQAGRYATIVPAGQVHQFGPLPDALRLSELSESAMDQLELVVAQLAERIIQVAALDRLRQDKAGQSSQNGRTA
jgi:hypothetical protein